ncbi:hypothetical protein BASA83_001776 [Batrachochytrium salamandrivorans]|nr:hypothetical protein BASA83_001776 [Batrachochytrium salamandrivorans]
MLPASSVSRHEAVEDPPVRRLEIQCAYSWTMIPSSKPGLRSGTDFTAAAAILVEGLPVFGIELGIKYTVSN